jgi:peptide chain release factor subunit 1
MIKELSTSDNIKSKQTRKGVQSALVSIIEFIKTIKNIPKNGIVICSSDEKIYAINPPKPITKVIYSCGKTFELEQVLDLFEEYDLYGVILISGKITKFYKISKNEIILIKSIEVDLPNRQGRGGQSKLRFERITEEKRHNYVKKVSEMSINYFTKNGKQIIKELIIGGFGELKDNLKECVNKYFSKIKIFDLPEIVDDTIHSVISKIDFNSFPEENIINDYVNDVDKIDKLIFGEIEIKENLVNNSIKILLVTRDYFENIETITNHKVKIIFMNDKNLIKMYGNAVGIKYY